MKPAEMHEISNVCRALKLSGLIKTPYPMVSARQEAKWERALRRDILGFIRKNYGLRAAKLAAQFPLFTLH